MINTIDHVIPTDDIRPHADFDCICKPHVSADGLLVIHNSFDGRELFEEENGKILHDAERFGLMR